MNVASKPDSITATNDSQSFRLCTGNDSVSSPSDLERGGGGGGKGHDSSKGYAALTFETKESGVCVI